MQSKHAIKTLSSEGDKEEIKNKKIENYTLIYAIKTCNQNIKQ